MVRNGLYIYKIFLHICILSSLQWSLCVWSWSSRTSNLAQSGLVQLPSIMLFIHSLSLHSLSFSIAFSTLVPTEILQSLLHIQPWLHELHADIYGYPLRNQWTLHLQSLELCSTSTSITRLLISCCLPPGLK